MNLRWRNIRKSIFGETADLRQIAPQAGVNGQDGSTVDDPEDSYYYSTTPIACKPAHILDLIDEKGRYKAIDYSSGNSTKTDDSLTLPKIRLDFSVSFTDIKSIDQEECTFSCKIRMYCFWKMDLQDVEGMEEVVKKAKKAEHFYIMTQEEIKAFDEASGIPRIAVMNAIEVDESDPHSMRVYGGQRGLTAIGWNRGYKLKCSFAFDYKYFPFDHQELVLELRLNDPRTWDRYDLTVSNVQFYRLAILNAEWIFREPKIKRDTPRHKATKIKIQLNRHPKFYVQNILMLFTGLVVMNLLCFAIPVDDPQDRMLGVFTNILNSVAFKLNYSEYLPLVPYNTLIDKYVLEKFAILGISAVLVVIPSFYVKHDEEFAKELNLILLFVVIFLILCNLSAFYLRIFWAVNSEIRMPEINLDNDKHLWFCYSFSQPHYLAAVPAPALSNKSRGLLTGGGITKRSMHSLKESQRTTSRSTDSDMLDVTAAGGGSGGGSVSVTERKNRETLFPKA